MKKQRFLVLILTMVFSIGLLSMQANAAPKKAAAAKEPFDAVFYAQANPDVVAVLGSKADALYKHYINYGKAEGRMATADAFDPVYYAQANPDVVAVLGNKADALYKHYIDHGKAEGRKANLNGTAAVPIAPTGKLSAAEGKKKLDDWIAAGEWTTNGGSYGIKNEYQIAGFDAAGEKSVEKKFAEFKEILSGFEDLAIDFYNNPRGTYYELLEAKLAKCKSGIYYTLEQISYQWEYEPFFFIKGPMPGGDVIPFPKDVQEYYWGDYTISNGYKFWIYIIY